MPFAMCYNCGAVVHDSQQPDPCCTICRILLEGV